MRTVSASILAKAQADDGHESSILIQIDTGSGLITLSERDIDGTDPRIMELGNLNMQIAEGAPATAGSISVKISDEDKYFLNLMCSLRLEGRTARVLQIYDGDISDQLELFDGKVGSPLVWEEESRTLSFDIVARYETNSDTEVPFAPDESSGLQEFAWNRPWPRVYGTPIDGPAVLIVDAPSGTLLRELKPLDSYFDIQVADGITFPTTEITVQVGNEYIKGTFVVLTTDPTQTLRFYITERNCSKGTIYSLDRAGLDSAENAPTGFASWQADPRYSMWDAGDLVLAGNWLFLLDTSDMVSSGIFSSTLVPNATGLYSYWSVPSFVGNKNYILYQKGNATRGQLPWLVPSGLYYISIGAKADVRGVLDVNDTLWPAGTLVTQVTSVKYVVNDVPSSAVLQIRAWREVQLDWRGGRERELVTVPSSFYTVNLNDTVAGRACTTVTFAKPLNTRGTGWDSEIFATVRSTVGSNVSDIIADLMTGAGITPDPVSFAAVKAACTKYPMNFAFTDRKDSLAVAGEIAFQGRCGLSVLSATAYLKYLSVLPTTFVFGYDDSNVLEGSLQVSSTELSSLTNDLWVTWHKRGSQQHPERLHYKDATSVTAFGRKKKELEIFVYRHKTLVQKTAQFWFNRWSHAWRKLRVIGDTDAIAVTVYDDVNSLLSELTIPGLVETLEHDTGESTIAVGLWTPAEVGSCAVSSYAYLDDTADVAPADLSLSAGDVQAEVIEVSPLDFTLTPKQTHVGEALTAETPAGTIGGIFNAKLYKSSNNTGVLAETSVSVQNLSNSPVAAGDVLTIHQSEDGKFFAIKGGGSGTTTALGGVMFGMMLVASDGKPTGFTTTPDGNDSRWNTVLTADQETKFVTWKANYAPTDSGYDYDYRGAYLAGVVPDPVTGHWTDKFKKPNHPTFSNESKYAYLMPHYVGYWTGANHDVYVPRDSNPDHYFAAQLFQVSAAYSTLKETRIGRLAGTNKPFDGQILPVYLATDGTAWILPVDQPFGIAVVRTDTGDKTSIQCRRYKTTDFTTTDTTKYEDIVVVTPALQSTAKITAGTWLVVMKINDAWVGYLPLIRPRVAN